MVIHINFISMCVHFEMSYTDWCISVSRCLGVNEAAETAAWWTRVGCWCWYWRQWLLHGPSQSYFYLVHNYHCLWGTVVTSHFAVTNEGKVTNKGMHIQAVPENSRWNWWCNRQGGICRGKPGNFPVTGSDLLSHWFVWKLRGMEIGRGGKGERERCLTPPPTGFCLKYHPGNRATAMWGVSNTNQKSPVTTVISSLFTSSVVQIMCGSLISVLAPSYFGDGKMCHFELNVHARINCSEDWQWKILRHLRRIFNHYRKIR